MRRPLALLSLAVLLAACGKANQSGAGPVGEGAQGGQRDPSAGPGTIKVAAAASLTDTFEEMAKAFEAKTGAKVTLSFGASGNLTRQLAEGAPFDVYAAADVKTVDQAIEAGACDGASKAPYAQGQLVLYTASGVTAPASIKDLADARYKKIAIANPEHAPYGMAATQAMQAAGVYDQVKPRLVYGENIKQAMQYVDSGNAEVGFIAASLLVGKSGTVAVDPASHAPILQAMVVCKNGGNAATAAEFVAFVVSAEGRAILARYGFALPDDAKPPN